MEEVAQVIITKSVAFCFEVSSIASSIASWIEGHTAFANIFSDLEATLTGDGLHDGPEGAANIASDWLLAQFLHGLGNDIQNPKRIAIVTTIEHVPL